jgi:hypothetical protein
MPLLPTSDIRRWPQILLRLDGEVMTAIEQNVAAVLEPAGEEIIRLARSQIAEDGDFSAALREAIKARLAAVSSSIFRTGDADA